MKHSNRLFLKAFAAFVLLALLITAAGCGKNISEVRTSGTQIPVISDAHMTSSVDVNGKPANTIKNVNSTGTWYVSAFLSNTQPNTIIRFVWYNAAGTVIGKTKFNPKGASDIYVYGSLKIPDDAYEHLYRVEIFINDSEPAATVYFTANDALYTSTTGPDCLPPYSPYIYSSSPSATSP